MRAGQLGMGAAAERRPRWQRGLRASSFVTLVVAVGLFLSVFGLREGLAHPNDGVGLLYVLPVAVLAIRFGATGGVLSAVLAAVLLVAATPNGGLPPLAYATRCLALLVIGLLVGASVDRERTMRRAYARGQTELAAANDQLSAAVAAKELANAALRATNDDLRQVDYVVGHDLREPLRSIKGFAQLLESRYGRALDETGRGYARYVVAGVEQMQELLNALRRYGEAGQCALRHCPVDANALVDEVIDALSAVLVERRARVEIESRLPDVEGDPAMLRVVLQNLISNAVKFNESERPTVCISGSCDEEGVSLHVSDNGIGIPASQRERVFGLFHRLHHQEGYPGSGVGLAISQRILARHGGSIDVSATPGEGSTFTVRLPRGERAAALQGVS